MGIPLMTPTAAIFLAETAIKSALIALVTLLALRLLRGAAPAVRHRAALGAFVLLALLPLAGLLPGAVSLQTSAVLLARWFAPRTPPGILFPPPANESPEPNAPRAVTPPPKSASETMPGDAPAPPAPPRRISLPLLLAGIGAGITAASLLAFASGLWRLRELYHASRPADERITPLRNAASDRLRIAPPFVRVSGAVGIPVAFGWRRPVIVLPEAAAEWEEARLFAALLHESAHIARRDFAAQCFARVVCAMYAWNPLVWKLYSVLRAEAETDCDARAVASGASSGLTPPEYAAHLFAIARQAGGGVAPFALAMARPHRPHLLEERIQMILTPRPGIRRLPVVLILLVAASCGVTVAGLRSASARASEPPGANPAPNAHFQTPDAPEVAPRNPVSFLKWSLRQYARAKTFEARWTWDLQFPGMAKGFDTGPTHIRTLTYAAPNQFRISATAYDALEHLFISDGKKFVVLQRGYGDAKPLEYPAPVSLAYAAQETLDHPHFGGGAIYRFFGGVAGMEHLFGADLLSDIENGTISTTEANSFYLGAWKERTIRRLSFPVLRFGEDVFVNGEPCKTLIFNGGVNADERRAIISLRDGLVRRLEYREFARELTPAESAEGRKNNEKEYTSEHFQNFPKSEQDSLRKIFDEGAERQRATLTIEEFTDIKVNASLPGNSFDTTFRFPKADK